jgi:hypothetical protein
VNSALEAALAVHRFWRNAGNDALVVFLVIEALLAAWPELPNGWSPWKVPPWHLIWLAHHLPSRQKLLLLAALGVAISVGIEIYAGNQADDVADQIRGNLQERVIAVSPRYWLLPLTVQHELAVALKAFAGQRVAILENTQQIARDPYSEIRLTQLVIAATLDESRWMNPWGERIMKTEGNGSNCTDCLEGPSNTFDTGIMIEADFRASEDTKKAVHALWEAFKSQHFDGFGWSNSANLQPLLTSLSPPLSADDSNVIVVTIGAKP